MKNRRVYLAAFDTEDDGKGNPHLFAVVHEKGVWHTTQRDKALEFLSVLGRDLKDEKKTLEVWATNLEYDIINLFGSERVSELQLRFGKSYLVGALWIGRNVRFRDTVRHIPVSVAELGQTLGLPKLRRGVDDETAYCIRDTTITYRAAKYLYDVYGEFDTLPKNTLASTAFHIWSKKYFHSKVQLPSDDIVNDAKQAYFGGRTEPFAIGEFENIAAVDASSMFPWAMLVGKLPIPWGDFKRVRKGEKQINPGGIYRVAILSNLLHPHLPFRSRNGTIYPNGEFIGWYVGEELIYFKERGGGVDILEGYEFKEYADPFRGYVLDFFEKKQRARGSARLGYKLLLNALYGKFGQTGDRIIATTLRALMQLKNPPEDFRIWNGLAIYREKGPPPPWGNNVWPAIITARARNRLAQEIENVYGMSFRPLYCDTDSIIFSYPDSAKIKYPEKAGKPGDFELRGMYRKALIVGKKEYGLQNLDGTWEIHVKGVPKIAREEYLRTGKATYQKPIKIKESSRRHINANVWVDITKERKVNFNDRNRDAAGFLAPIVINTIERPISRIKKG